MSIQKKDTKDLVYEYIKGKILKLEYRSGDIINIAHLTNELNISNTPIREAISMLQSEGLVVASGTKYRVVTFTEKILSDLNEACLVLITGALGICAERGRLDALAGKLRHVLDKQIASSTTASECEFTFTAVAFDRCFIETSQNKCLLDIFNTQANLLSLSTSYVNALSRQRSIDQHKDILQAVENKDMERAIQLLAMHYDKRLQDIFPD